MHLRTSRLSIALALPALIAAFPSYLHGSHSIILEDQSLYPRDEPVAIVDPTQLVPDADHPFQLPGPTDQRGPCPGLNTLANHGYLPRSGIVSLDDVVNATATGFNMAKDLAEFLYALTIGYNGDLTTGLFSIGGSDQRTAGDSSTNNVIGYESGIGYHGAGIEGDTSSTRRDAYFGDNVSMDPELYAQMKSIAANHGGLYTVEAMNDVQEVRYRQGLTTNPHFYFVPLPGPHVVGGKAFVPQFFSNGTYGAGGVPNEASISSFLGAELQPDGSYKAVPERFPENWYRRNVSFAGGDALQEIFNTFQAKSLPYGANAGKVGNFVPLDIAPFTNATELLCTFLYAIEANVPSAVTPVNNQQALLNALIEESGLRDDGCPPINPNDAAAYEAVNKWYNTS